MADITSTIEYYVNLLIIQYHNKPKAQATIRLFAEVLLANGIALDVRDGYDLETAVGVQLDVLGKYEGIDRFYRAFNPTDYFSLQTYTESTPTFPPRHGFTDYAHYLTDPPAGCLIYSEIISSNNRLVDDAFRTLIKLKIVQNYSNHSNGSIDESLFSFFGTSIRMEDSGNMHMVYFISSAIDALIQAILYKKVLPVPMAVGAVLVTGITGPMFALVDYTLVDSPFAYGLSTYANYASLDGQVLSYDQMTEM